MRRTIHWPSAGVQSSVPSGRIFAVRSTTSLLRTASSGATAGVGRSESTPNVAKAAFSSKRCTRAPEWRTSSATAWPGGTGGASSTPPTAKRSRGAARKVTRKKRARTGSNDTVFCSARLRGIGTIVRKRLAVVARLELGAGRTRRPPRGLRATHRKRDGADRLRLRVFELDPGLLAVRRRGQRDGADEVAVGQQRGVDRAGARAHHRVQGLLRHVARGHAIRDDGGVAVELRQRGSVARGGLARRDVLEGPGRGRRLRQRAGERPATFDARLAPDELLHRLLRLHPRAARLAPARGAGDGRLQPQPVCELDRVTEGVLPLRGHVGDALLDHGVAEERGVEVLEAAEPDPLHPLEVAPDAFLRDVAVHPVPPHAGSCGRWRRHESLVERVGRRGFRERRGRGGGLRRLAVCRSRSGDEREHGER